MKFFERWLLRLMVGGFVLLAVGFSLGPIFEGPDEIEHYRYLRTVAATRALPAPTGQPWGEYHQAPLFYVLMAPLVAFMPDDDFAAIENRLNPHYPYQFELPGNDNKNLYLHSKAEAFPYTNSPTARTVHLLRLVSVALGTGTVVVCLKIVRLLWPEHPERRLLALGFVAFWPQLAYISSVITNDNLLILLATLALFLVVRLHVQGPSWRSALWLGVVLGAALLTKSSALILAVPVGYALLVQRRMWRYSALTLLVAFAIGGWWYVRNLMLYGDLTGIQAMYATWPNAALQPSGTLDLGIGLARGAFVYQTFWARFGGGAVAVSGGMYAFYDVLTVLAAAGTLVGVARGLAARCGWAMKVREPAFIAALFALVWVPAVIYYASVTFSGNQGRFLMPGAAGWGALFAFGLSNLFPRRYSWLTAGLVAAILAGVAISAQLAFFHPAYRPLPAPAEMERELAVVYGESAELIGISASEWTVQPGEMIVFELYWRALQPSDSQLTSYLHTAFAPDLVWRDSYPGNGHLLATEWEPGQTWTERYVVQIPAHAAANEYLLVAGLYDPEQGQVVAARDAAGNDLGPAPVVGTLRIE